MLKILHADIKTIAESSTHLDPQERNELYTLLKKYECLFDGNLGTWYVKPYDIKLKPDAEPYHGKHFPVPRIHELTFKQELDQIEFLVESEVMYAWTRKRFPMIWFCIWLSLLS